MDAKPRERGQNGGRGLLLLGWATLVVSVLATAAGAAYSLWSGEGVDIVLIAMLSFPVVGSLVVSREPLNAVGWILLGVGLAWSLPSLVGIYAEYGLSHPGSLPRPDIALALNEPTWVPSVGLMGTFLILLFPDGHLPSPRWRKLAWLSAVAMTVSFLVILFAPVNFAESGHPEIENPLGIDGLRPFLGAAFSAIALIPICILGCAAGLIQRFRRARGHERLQLKWLAAAGGVVASAYLAVMATALSQLIAGREPTLWNQYIGTIVILLFVLIPVAIGVAILRHRLYDIDLIINRALVYGSLTAGLTIAYLVTVTVLQSVLRPVTGQSELAVAGSTLAVAALFRPSRLRTQAFIDRRFYRTKYDAEHTLETFSAKLRDEIDLDALSSELVALVTDVMEPRQVSLWLRESHK
ncbi:MAG: hypothetical protein M3454_03115 [Actinomycetota bacterium]|nr:hypothetical protein [Actinomycetota bacterium]